MQVPLTNAHTGPTLPGIGQFVQRLAAQVAQGVVAGRPAQPEAPTVSPTLTPAMLRAALLEMGVTANPQNLALAEAFARLGLALTVETLAAAHGALARAPQASPLAYALARSWSLPTTPAALNALAAVAEGARTPPQTALPAELMSWLSLTLDVRTEPEEMAAHLFVMAQGAGRSTEHRLTHHPAGADLAAFRDTKTTLLRLAQGSGDRAIRQGADALASHLEGQQLVNQAARQHEPSAPFYLAVPVLLGAEAALAEMRLWPGQADDEDAPPGTPWLRATLRLTTKRLGRVQVELAGTLGSALSCRLGAEAPATVRLLQRHAGALAASLSALGDWPASDVQCRRVTEWPPLWHGGDALAAPRPCVDWRA